MNYLANAIGHVQINVTDLDACVRDATDVLGLRITNTERNSVWLSSNGRSAELVLHLAAANATRLIAFEALSPEAVDEARHRLDHFGCKLVSTEPSLACARAGIVFSTPEGLLFELHTPVPDDVSKRRWATTGIRPSRIDHVNITSPDPVKTRERLEGVLGLMLSERMVDDGLSWMRGGNRQHHILGIVRGTPGLHHYAFELPDFQDYMQIGDSLDLLERQLVWGPGRHRPGDNIFAYYLDPSGAMVELSSGMSIVADDSDYVAPVITQLKRPDNVRRMNSWGPPAPQPWLEHRFPFAPI